MTTQNADTSQEKSARHTPQLKVNKIVYPGKQDVLNGLWSGISDFRRKALTDSNSQTLDGSIVQVPVLRGTLKKIAAAIAKAEKP